MLIATAGHVDHGKTLLVHALTGVDTDRLPEEKARGLTIDLGFAYQRLEDGTRLAFVDVPGHEKFIRNMIAGVPAVDFALLVVAADDGPMPQTAEHLSILDLLGIQRGFVVMTKTDRVDAQRRAEVADEVVALCQGSCLRDAALFQVSAVTGEGIQSLAEALQREAAAGGQAASDGMFRLAVDRVFAPPGAGVVVTGAVYEGQVQVGDRVTLVPRGDTLRVRAIEMAGGGVQCAVAGERCALSLSGRGVGVTDLRRGNWLVGIEPVLLSERVDVRVRLLKSEPRALKHWSSVHVHHGADFLAARISPLEGAPVAPGEDALAQVVLERPTCLFHGDLLLLRDPAGRRTMGGARIIDPFAPRRVRDRAARLALLRESESDDVNRAFAAALRLEPEGVDAQRFAQARGVPAEALAQVAHERGTVRLTLRGDGRLFDARRVHELADALAASLQEFHARQPELTGPDRDALLGGIAADVSNPALRALLEEQVRSGAVVREGSCYRHPAHEARLSRAEARQLEALRTHLTPTTLKAPSVSELAERMKMERGAMLDFLKQCERRGQVVRVADNRYFDARALGCLAQMAEELASTCEAGRFDARGFRDASGIGRNLSIDVLEFFDRKGFTRRVGDLRVVMKGARALFG